MIVEIADEAAAEFSTSLDYLRARNGPAANRIRAAVERAIDSLSVLPNRGRNGALIGTREIVARETSYVVVYQVAAERVLVLRIRHISQDPQP